MTHTTSVNRHRFDAEESRQALLIHRFCPHPKVIEIPQFRHVGKGRF
jgi:hypothetical protein